MVETLGIIWFTIVLLLIIGSVIYMGYKGEELSFQDKEDLQDMIITFMFLPVILAILAIASPYFIIWGLGKLIRYGVDYGRSKKNRFEKRA